MSEAGIVEGDAEDDPAFDPARDTTGCEVEEQDPAAGEILAEGEEVTVSVSCAQVDWENHEGTAWEAFDAAYTSGFDAGCDALFNESPSGSLYEDERRQSSTSAAEAKATGDASGAARTSRSSQHLAEGTGHAVALKCPIAQPPVSTAWRVVLSIGKLASGQANYYLEQAQTRVNHATSVGTGVEDYYVGGAEAPGSWTGLGSEHLRTVGVVEPEALYRVLEGQHPETGRELVARARV